MISFLKSLLIKKLAYIDFKSLFSLTNIHWYPFDCCPILNNCLLIWLLILPLSLYGDNPHGTNSLIIVLLILLLCALHSLNLNFSLLLLLILTFSHCTHAIIAQKLCIYYVKYSLSCSTQMLTRMKLRLKCKLATHTWKNLIQNITLSL